MEGINYNWTFLESIRNVNRLKKEYEDGLKEIPLSDTKRRAEYIKSIRDEIYKIKLKKLWQTEMLWDYMNGDIEFKVLISQGSK